jgi:hypothetical protein
VSATPFWALMAFSFILIVEPHNTFLRFLGPLRIALLSAAVAMITYLNDRISRGQPLSIMTREFKLAACLGGLALVSVPLSRWPGGSFWYFFDVFFKSLVVFWLLSNSLNTVTQFRKVAWALSVMALPLAVTAVKNYVTGTYVGGGVGHAVKRIMGYGSNLASNPNDLALMLCEMLPFTVALYLVSRKPTTRMFAVAIIVLEVTAVIVTFSRMGFLILAALFAMYQVKVFKRSVLGVAIGMLLVGILMLPFLPSSYIDHMLTILDVDSDPTGSAQVRWADMNTAVDVLLTNPFVGGGVGMDELAINEVAGKVWRPVHNAYLRHGVELGVFGLVLFVWLLISCIKSASFVYRRCQSVPANGELACYAQAIQISLIAFAIGAVFSPNAYSFMFYYFAGLAVAVRATYWTVAEREDENGRNIRS